MRINEDNKKSYNNEEDLKYISKQLENIFNLPSYLVRHMIYSVYLAILHKKSCEAIDNDEKLKNIEIEIPHFGRMYINIEDSNISVSKFELEEEFKKDIKDLTTTGESRLLSSLKKKFIERITERYNNILG